MRKLILSEFSLLAIPYYLYTQNVDIKTSTLYPIENAISNYEYEIQNSIHKQRSVISICTSCTVILLKKH